MVAAVAAVAAVAVVAAVGVDAMHRFHCSSVAAIWAVAQICLLALPASSQQTPAVDAFIHDGNLAASSGFQLDLSVRPSRRYAVVIGNAHYQSVPGLKNAIADANLVAGFLKRQGYEVKEHYDVTKREFEQILRRTLFDVSKDTEVVFYFAGHGFQIGTDNYIVPVDADLKSAYDVPFETVSLGSLVSIIGARARVQTVILDSCRNNPFAGVKAVTQIGNELRQSETGFATLAAPVNSLLVFSTSPGTVAYDGDGANSPFTAALVQVASDAPKQSVGDVFERVRRLVYQRTDGRQVPWESSTLIEPVSFYQSEDDTVTAAAAGGGSGATRGLLLQTAAVIDKPSPVKDQPVDIVLGARLERDIDVGSALKTALRLGDADTVAIVKGPKNGRLAVAQANGKRRAANIGELPVDNLAKLVFVSEFPERSGVGFDQDFLFDTFRVSVNGVDQTIGLQMEVNQCDVQAGDQLDPDGVVFARFANQIEPEKALAACTAAVRAEPDNGRLHYQLGRVYSGLRRHGEARAEFEKARDLGHTRAWYALGNVILNQQRETGGNASDKAPKQALALYSVGVEKGDPYAYYALGRQLMRYGGGNELQIQGYDLMMRALEVGHTFAMNELGYFYLDEHSKYYDPKRGLRYLRESAARDDIYGFNNMGLVYRNGLGGVKPDPKQALAWFTKAANGGHPVAPTNLGLMYAKGVLGGRPDYKKAVQWYDVGLARGDAWAGANAGYILTGKKVRGMTPADGVVRAAKAAALRNPEAQASALKLLHGLPAKVVDAGTQTLMNQLGESISVDGAFGAQSKAALAALLGRYDRKANMDDPVDRAVELAHVFWFKSPFRVDLY